MDRKRIILYAAIASVSILLVVLTILLLPGILDDGIVNVGICIADEDEAAYAEALEAALTQKGYAVQIADARNDQSLQNQQIHTFIKEKYDALVVSMVMTSTAEELVEIVKQAQIPTVLISSQPELTALEGWDKICFVGCDPSEPGMLQTQLVENLPNKGDINDDGTVSYILLQGDPERISTTIRTDSLMTALSESGIPTAELARAVANGHRKDARIETAKLLAQMGKDIEVILCNNDEMALGALEAIVDGGRTVGKDIYLIGIDGTQEALGKVASGEMTATVLDDLQAQATQVGALIESYLAGNAVEKLHRVPHISITSENTE